MTGSRYLSCLTPVSFVLCLAPHLYAQEPLSLDGAVRRALRNHPLLMAESARIAVAAGFQAQAGMRPNPRLTVQSENWTFSGAPQPIASTFTDQFLYVSQLLETAGKRQRRIDLAEAGVRATHAERQVVIRQIVSRVKLAYWAAAGAQRVVDLLRENQQNLLQTVRYHETQVREGAIAEADLVRVRLE